MHIHFIGIGGSAIAPLAIMLKQLGNTVTGSDHNPIWDPAQTLLTEAQIPFTENGDINLQNVHNADLIIIGASTLLKDPNNAEYIEAQKLNKSIHAFPYLVQKYITKKNSIVVAGTYGKSTTTSALAWIWQSANLKPSFMIGGKPLNFQTGVSYSNGTYSIVEGDEFITLPQIDPQPKFLYYNPTQLIITAAQWDHLDVYKTEEAYIQAFKNLIDILQKNKGLLLIAKNGKNNENIIQYFNNHGQTYLYEYSDNINKAANTFQSQISSTTDKEIKFSVFFEGVLIGTFETQLFGKHNLENLTAAIALAYLNKIPIKVIQQAIKTFKGIRRRQELYKQLPKGGLVYDDFAHSTIKGKTTLEAFRSRFPKKNITVIFSPRIGENDNREALKGYPKSFDKADTVIIPHIPVKKSIPKENRIHGKDIINAIKTTQPNAIYMPMMNQIKDFILKNDSPNNIFIFMGSGDLISKVFNEN